MRAFLLVLVTALVLASAPAGAPKVVNDGHGDYLYVPAGAFRMGDNFGDGDPRERPVHVVELDAFYIAKFEMTNGEWKKFRDNPGYDDPKFWPGGKVVPKNQVPYWNDPRNHGGGTPDTDNYPLLGVNWDSAVAYCNWLSADDRQEIPPAHRSRMGESRARHRSAPLSVGQPDRSLLRELCGRAEIRYRAVGGLLRWRPARRSADAQQCFAVRRHGYGGQRHGMVLGLVQPRLLLGVAA